jgi:hypothetical protein
MYPGIFLEGLRRAKENIRIVDVPSEIQRAPPEYRPH